MLNDMKGTKGKDMKRSTFARLSSRWLWGITLFVVMFLVIIHVEFIVLDSSDASDIDDEEGCPPSPRVVLRLMNNVTSKELVKRWHSKSRENGRILAVHRTNQNYLALGLALDGCRSNESASLVSVANVLSQLINHTSTNEKLETVVLVVLLGSVDDQLADTIVQMIADNFLDSVAVGYVQVIQESGPVKKCAVHEHSSDIAALMLVRKYVTSLASHYLHVGDASVQVAPNFVQGVKDFVQRETEKRKRGSTWTILDFGSSTCGDLSGVLVRSAEVARFAVYLFDFDGKDVSKLLTVFLNIVSQRSCIVRRPALIRRPQNDEANEPGLVLPKPWLGSDDPDAMVLSSMHGIGRHSVMMAYSSSGDYFKASMPVVGDWVTVVFNEDVFISKIKIQTGLESGSFPLLGGTVEASPRLLKLDALGPTVLCADFVRLGEIGPGTNEFDNVDQKVWGRPTRCLRITVTSADGSDVVFHQIAIYGAS